jgi:hypothetical protein
MGRYDNIVAALFYFIAARAMSFELQVAYYAGTTLSCCFWLKYGRAFQGGITVISTYAPFTPFYRIALGKRRSIVYQLHP